MKKKLMDMGLSESESAVYAALLELGPSSVSEITKKAGVSRTLGYHVLEKLGWGGLVSETTTRSRKKTYVAEHPRNLVQYVRNKAKSWERRVTLAENELPDLLSLYKVDAKPAIRYQEGPEGVIALFEESLGATTTIFSILDVESWQTSDFWDWAKSYNRERNKRKKKEYILILDTPAGREWVKNYIGLKVYTEYRWVKKSDIQDLLQFGGEMNVYDEKVMIAMLNSPKQMGVIIEGKVLANIVRAMFQLVWENAEPVSF